MLKRSTSPSSPKKETSHTAPIAIPGGCKQSSDEEQSSSWLDGFFSLFSSPKTPSSPLVSPLSTHHGSSLSNGSLSLLASSPTQSSLLSARHSGLLGPSASSPAVFPSSSGPISSSSLVLPKKISDLARSPCTEDEPVWFQDLAAQGGKSMDEFTVATICQKIVALTLCMAETADHDKIERISLQIEALARDVTADLKVKRSASMESYLKTLDPESKQRYLTTTDRFNKRQERLMTYLTGLDSVTRGNFLTAVQSLRFKGSYINELRTIATQFVIDQAKNDSQSVVPPSPSLSR